MRTGRQSKAFIRSAIRGSLLFLFLVASGAPDIIAGPLKEPAPLADHLAGNTLSAVVFVQRSIAAAAGDALRRFALQAYLRQDGSASVRVWVTARDAYTAPAERNWTLSDDMLCLDTPQPGPGKICANVHIWGPRIAGIGTKPYVMLDGDLRPGNVIFATR